MSGLRSLYSVYCWDYELDVHVIRHYLVTAVHEAFPVTHLSDSIRTIPTSFLSDTASVCGCPLWPSHSEHRSRSSIYSQ
jgi:hypothetical protein